MPCVYSAALNVCIYFYSFKRLFFERGSERERSCTQWFMTQMPTTASPGPSESQEPGAPSGCSSREWQGPTTYTIICCLLACMSRTLDWKQNCCYLSFGSPCRTALDPRYISSILLSKEILFENLRYLPLIPYAIIVVYFCVQR